MDQPASRRSFEGDFSDRPFPILLFSLWQERATGSLVIKETSARKKVDLLNGSIILSREDLKIDSFCSSLAEKKLLSPGDLKSCKETGQKKNDSILKIFIEKRLFSPDKLWQLMEEYALEDMIPLFDRPDGGFFFDTGEDALKMDGLLVMSVPEFIRQGVDRMENIEIFVKHLPGKTESENTLSLRNTNRISFRPHEKYLMHLINKHKNLEEVYSASELGRSETQRAAYYLLCAGVLVASHHKGNNNPSGSISPSGLQNRLEELNRKSAFIHKFMSKEIGPVSLKVLEKSILEIKNYLSPLFENVKLHKDGKIDIKSVLKAQMTLPGRESGQFLNRDLNEILAAEVLAVKKTLGSEKETLLLNGLKNI